MANYKEDIVSIDLENGNIHRSFLRHSIGEGDNIGQVHHKIHAYQRVERISSDCAETEEDFIFCHLLVHRENPFRSKFFDMVKRRAEVAENAERG